MDIYILYIYIHIYWILMTFNGLSWVLNGVWRFYYGLLEFVLSGSSIVFLFWVLNHVNGCLIKVI